MDSVQEFFSGNEIIWNLLVLLGGVLLTAFTFIKKSIVMESRRNIAAAFRETVEDLSSLRQHADQLDTLAAGLTLETGAISLLAHVSRKGM